MVCATAQIILAHPSGVKKTNIINFQLQSQFQRFLKQTLCVFSQMKDIKHIRHDFYFHHLGHASGVGLMGAGGQKFNFLNMVMWHVKSEEQDIRKNLPQD